MSREKKWTPGPWAIEWFCGETQFVSADEHPICQMWNKMEENFPNSQNNAPLIAKAPELVEALEETTDLMNEAMDKLLEAGHEGFVGEELMNRWTDNQELLAEICGDTNGPA